MDSQYVCMAILGVHCYEGSGGSVAQTRAAQAGGRTNGRSEDQEDRRRHRSSIVRMTAYIHTYCTRCRVNCSEYVCMYVCMIFIHEEYLSAFKSFSLCIYMYVWTTGSSMKKERSVGGIISDNDPPLSTDLGYVCVCVYVYMYVCMYACMNICTMNTCMYTNPCLVLL